MNFILSPVEARVLGSLLEKELTTPDNYPLSLVALTAACNQKSSREPVMNLDEPTVLDTVNILMKKYLVRERGGASSRVSKYAHRFVGNMEPADDLSQRQRALLALLILRGPQTLGELRTRSGRMYNFESLEEVEQTLSELAERKGGPYTAEIPRQPGQRERRFMHLLCGDEVPELLTEGGTMPIEPDTLDRITALEDEISALRNELTDVRSQLTELRIKLESRHP